jgi:predicted ArsR family transcriptional regulator
LVDEVAGSRIRRSGIQVPHEDDDTLALKYANCPFCETFNLLGLPEMGAHVCQSDWEIAKDNADLWDFERSHQIGTGDEYCDHTYLRKQAQERAQ